MVTQILFGEHFEILENKGNWIFVRLAYDNYECWIENKQFLPITGKIFKELNTSPIVCFTDLIRFVVCKDDSSVIPIVLGSSLPYFRGNICNLGGSEYSFYEKQGNGDDKTTYELVREYSKKYLNAPYLWGGRSLFGIDCSGFTQMVFKLCGIRLPRDSHQQAETGKTINMSDEIMEGDLAFFEKKDKKITHVGILLGNHKIIHASGIVRIDTIDQEGIYNHNTKEYTHKLRLVKRIVP